MLNTYKAFSDIWITFHSKKNLEWKTFRSKKNWNGKWFIEYIGQYLIPTDDSHGVYPVPERLWSFEMREKEHTLHLMFQFCFHKENPSDKSNEFNFGHLQ